MENSYEIGVIGGGILGLATARALNERAPRARLVVLEKEAKLATHQTGNNSGVIHSGIYYKPGSLKALNCRRGKAMLEAFCREHGLPFETCGKVVVATAAEELPRLEAIAERARANGVASQVIGPERLRELEPHAAGLRALHVPETGIVDYVEVCQALARLVRAQVKSVRERTYVKRVRAVGAGNSRLIGRHILPQVAPLLIANTVLMVAVTIFAVEGPST